MKPLMVFSFNPNYVNQEVMETFMQQMRDLGYNCLSIAHHDREHPPVYYVVKEEPKEPSIWEDEARK